MRLSASRVASVVADLSKPVQVDISFGLWPRGAHQSPRMDFTMSFKTSIAAPDTATAIAFAMPSSSHPLTYIALTATMMPQANPRIHARYRFVRARRARRVLLPVIASCLRLLTSADALFALVPVVVLVSPFIVETPLLYISRPESVRRPCGCARVTFYVPIAFASPVLPFMHLFAARHRLPDRGVRSARSGLFGRSRASSRMKKKPGVPCYSQGTPGCAREL